MSKFCRGCGRELPKDRKGTEQYCSYCIDGMNFVFKTKKSKDRGDK